ncbi:hypothetical protein WJX79_002329 [Trebouxia sp. C0005]
MRSCNAFAVDIVQCTRTFTYKVDHVLGLLFKLLRHHFSAQHLAYGPGMFSRSELLMRLGICCCFAHLIVSVKTSNVWLIFWLLWHTGACFASHGLPWPKELFALSNTLSS